MKGVNGYITTALNVTKSWQSGTTTYKTVVALGSDYNQIESLWIRSKFLPV